MYCVHAQTARRRTPFYNVLGDPTATNADALALFRRCRRPYCMCFGILHFFKDAAGAPSGHSPGMTGFSV